LNIAGAIIIPTPADYAKAISDTGFTPASFAALTGWWRADSYVPPLADETPIDALPVNALVDLSGGGRNMSKGGVSADKFVYDTNNAMSPTRPILRGSDIFVPNLDFSPELSFSGDFTIIMTVSTNVGADTLWLGHTGVNHQCRRNTSGANVMSFYAGGSLVQSSALSGGAGLSVLTWRRQSGVVSFRENKAARGTAAEASTARFNSVCNNLFLGTGAGNLAEIVVYSQFRTDAEVDALYDGYLKPRWTALP